MIDVKQFKKDLIELAQKYDIYFDGISKIESYPPNHIETIGLGGAPITYFNVEQRIKLECEFTIVDN